MFESTDDLRIDQLKPLIPPAILMEELPISEAASHTVAAARRVLDAILTGEDDRLVAVVGPCSIHDPQAALEYAERLKEKATDLSDELYVVMRVYFEKPRTTVGWKGLINDPHLDDSFEINSGLRAARGLLVQLGDMGLPSCFRIPRYDHAAIYRRPDCLGCHWCSHYGKSGPPRIGFGSVDARWL